jgi:type II restriction enzyme
VKTQIRVRRSSVVKISRISPTPIRRPPSSNARHYRPPPAASTLRSTCYGGRAGWVGCNFALTRVPADARIPVVTESRISLAAEVREKFKRVKPLKEISATQRGWTLDVLNIVRRISEVETAGSAVRAPSRHNVPAALPPVTPQRGVPTNTFTTAEVYAFARELEKLHPDNRHVKDKIRQQLQVLRDMGLLRHVERGLWRLP